MISISPNYLMYYVPLIIAISLVFGGTRQEETSKVLAEAWKTGRWITMFMLMILIVVSALSWLIG